MPAIVKNTINGKQEERHIKKKFNSSNTLGDGAENELAKRRGINLNVKVQPNSIMKNTGAATGYLHFH